MYQALYRKYRPQTFDEVVGQIGVTQTLQAQLQSGKLSHAYLFTGSSRPTRARSPPRNTARRWI